MSEKRSQVPSPEARGEDSGKLDYQAPRWAWWVATGFGSGYLKPAPGTWGSLAAVAVWWILLHYFRCQWLEKWVAQHDPIIPPLALALGMTILAIMASDRVVHETGLKDPGFIVADEWAGMWIALAPILWHVGSLSPGWGLLRVVTPFALFRLFDIWKPWPCYQLQVLRGGTGVVIDDVAAGIYAAVMTFFIDGWLVRHLAILQN